MEYSVGSLSDLITGSNTPNKAKVIKQEFKKETLDTSENSLGEKRPKKESKKDATFKMKSKSIKKAKLSRNIKYEIKTEPEVLGDANSENDNDDNKRNKKRGKGKKRKLEKSTPKIENADLDESEEPPQKKEKLSKNEVNAERRIKKKNKEQKPRPSPEELSRTIYVGNVPITTKKNMIKKHFKKYGEIESVRFRGIPVADPKTSKKVAAIKKEYNPNRSNVFCYVRFVNKESAKEAEAENGALFEEHHLRVHCCESKDKPDESKAIFVGNLSFTAEEDELWNLFESCGPISYVRIIRDSYTGMGKGFAYVNFKDSDAVQLALEMENVKLKDRELRISLSNLTVAKKNKKQNKKKKSTRPRRSKKNIEGNSMEGNQESDGQQVKVKRTDAGFQGTKFSDKKKKHKVNKGLLQKKKLVKKIAPKSDYVVNFQQRFL